MRASATVAIVEIPSHFQTQAHLSYLLAYQRLLQAQGFSSPLFLARPEQVELFSRPEQESIMGGPHKPLLMGSFAQFCEHPSTLPLPLVRPEQGVIFINHLHFLSTHPKLLLASLSQLNQAEGVCLGLRLAPYRRRESFLWQAKVALTPPWQGSHKQPPRLRDAYDYSGTMALPLKLLRGLLARWQLLSPSAKKSEQAWLQLLWEVCLPGQIFGLPLPGKALADEAAVGNSSQALQSSLRPCLFLDRDGIIIDDVGYPYKLDELILLKDVIPLIQWAKQQGWLVIVVSNQAGLAKGKFTQEDLNRATAHLQQLLTRQHAQVDAWYYCPYHPAGVVAAYTSASQWRKPAPGMILQALSEWPIDPLASYMVGDKESDRIALPYLRSLLVQGRYPLNPEHGPTFANLAQLTAYLQQQVAG